MSSLLCSITGAVPEEPVVSKTGYIFEKRIIEDHLKSFDTCPVSGEELSLNDLTPVKASKLARPRLAASTTIPGLMSLLQTEWDALMTETFDLRKQYLTIRHQLSHSLYQHDAACRVIGRLIKERDTLKHQLTQLQRDLLQASSQGSHTGSPQFKGFSEETLSSVQHYARLLMAQRKARSSEPPPSRAGVSAFQLVASYTLHSASRPGITALCMAKGDVLTPSEDAPRPQGRFYTGGVDGYMTLFDIARGQPVGRLAGHLRRINQIVVHPKEEVVVSCSDDKTARIWIPAANELGDPAATMMIDYKTSYILQKHQKPITSVSMHPTGDFFTTSSKDGSWGCHEVHSGQTCELLHSSSTVYKKVAFHPDGVLLGAIGDDAKVYMHDLKALETPLMALEAHTLPIIDFAFSETGYHLATVAEDHSVKIWDLRKSQVLDTLQLTDDPACPLDPTYVAYDIHGDYLSVGGKSGRTGKGAFHVYQFESRSKLDLACTLEDHADVVTTAMYTKELDENTEVLCCRFGPSTSYLVSASMDRTVKIWAPNTN